MFKNSALYAEMKKRAQHEVVHPPQNETYWYTSGQSYLDLNRVAVYIQQHDRKYMNVLMQEFDTSREAEDAATAFNRARPFEYPIVDALIRQVNHQPIDKGRPQTTAA